MTRIGLMGDTHGSSPWMRYCLEKMNREDIRTIIQLGDFGIWPGESGGRFAKATNLTLKNFRQTMYVVPGNHEDYDQIDATSVSDDGWQHFRSNILLAPRGHRWEWGGRSFVALGGAPSVDRAYRLNSKGSSKSWWAQEAITQADVDKVVAGGPADIMIAHDAPNGIRTIEENIAGNPMGFEKIDLEYAAEGRKLMTEAFTAVQPKLFFHGHYHFLVDEIVDDTRVLGLSCDGQNFSLGVLDTNDMTAEAWDIAADYRLNAR